MSLYATRNSCLSITVTDRPHVHVIWYGTAHLYLRYGTGRTAHFYHGYVSNTCLPRIWHTTGIPRTFCTKCVHCTEDLVKNICIKVIAKFSLKSVVTDDWFAVHMVGEDEFVCTCILSTPKTVAHVGYANSSSLFIFSVLPARSV